MKYILTLFILISFTNVLAQENKNPQIKVGDECDFEPELYSIDQSVSFEIDILVSDSDILVWNFGDDCNKSPFYERKSCDVLICGTNKIRHSFSQPDQYLVSVTYKGKEYTKTIEIAEKPKASFRTETCKILNNGDFENYSSIPSMIGQISFAKNWKSANKATPDYFHRSSKLKPEVNWGIGIPKNFAGKCNDNTGNAYAGILTYYESGTPSSLGDSATLESKNYREYIYQEFSDSLIYGIEYVVTMDVRYASKSRVHTPIGYYVSDTNVKVNHYNTIQIQNTTEYFNITDTSKWETITDTFRADGNEKYILIGNFRNDNSQYITDKYSSNYIQSRYDSIKVTACYYYINDVKLTPVYIGGIVSEGDDNLLTGGKVKLKAESYLRKGLSFIQWSTKYPINDLVGQENSQEIEIEITVPNTIYLDAIDECGNQFKDSITYDLSGINNPKFGNEDLVIILYPNPSKGVINIKSNSSFEGPIEFSITDALGKTVFHKQENNVKNRYTLNIPTTLADGTYFLKLHSKDQVCFYKFILSK